MGKVVSRITAMEQELQAIYKGRAHIYTRKQRTSFKNTKKSEWKKTRINKFCLHLEKWLDDLELYR